MSWNLSSASFSEIPMIMITFANPEIDEYETKEIRELILSHQLSKAGIPAIYLTKEPKYMGHNRDVSVIIVFDINGKFVDYELPFWANCEKWTWNVSNDFTTELADHFSRALVMVKYYENLDLNPIYFSAFLLIPPGRNIIEPFLFLPAAVKRNGMLYIRTILQGGLEGSLIKKPQYVGSFILVPPYENPFQVMQISDNSYSALSVDRKIHNFSLKNNVPIFHLTKPSTLLPSFFVGKKNYNFKTYINNINNIEDIDLFSFTFDDIFNYFENGGNEKEKSEEKQVDILEEPIPTFYQVLSEQEFDKNTRKIIGNLILNSSNFPSSRLETKCIIANFLSFFRFDFGFSNITPPKSAYKFLNNTKISYQKIGIPFISVIKNSGYILDVKADTIINDWIEERYLPISGVKSCSFVVFANNDISCSCVKAFMSHLSYIYNLYGFGTLRPFHSSPFQFVQESIMPSTIMDFFTKYSTTEYQQCPVLSFIIGNPIYITDFHPHSIITYIRPSSVISASEEEIKTLAFVVYSRIRLMSPTPLGMIDMHQNDASPLIFGFRYQPPFLLKRKEENSSLIGFHYAWDYTTKKFSVVDDIGSILHVLVIDSIDRLSLFIQDCCNIVENHVSQKTLSILAEGLSASFLEEFKSKLDQDILLFSVYPASTVQILFDEDFDDDVIIEDVQQIAFSEQEKYLEPISSVYIASKYHPSYKASVYHGSKEDLIEYVKTMSNLSWLSVKPGQEKRTISYPPHICALLRKNGCDTTVLSKFEFLPTTEQI